MYKDLDLLNKDLDLLIFYIYIYRYIDLEMINRQKKTTRKWEEGKCWHTSSVLFDCLIFLSVKSEDRRERRDVGQE